MIFKYTTYQDEGGLFHHVEKPNTNSSENAPLFSAEVAVFAELNGFHVNKMDIENIKVSDVDFRDRYNGNIPCHFSLDNMTGLWILKELGYHSMDLPICRWNTMKPDLYNRKYWFHPRELILFTAWKFKVLSPILLPLLTLFALDSCLRSEPTRNTGRCKWFAILGCTAMSKNVIFKYYGLTLLRMLDILMIPRVGKYGFVRAYADYFKDQNHPCNVEIRRYYGI